MVYWYSNTGVPLYWCHVRDVTPVQLLHWTLLCIVHRRLLNSLRTLPEPSSRPECLVYSGSLSLSLDTQSDYNTWTGAAGRATHKKALGRLLWSKACVCTARCWANMVQQKGQEHQCCWLIHKTVPLKGTLHPFALCFVSVRVLGFLCFVLDF